MMQIYNLNNHTDVPIELVATKTSTKAIIHWRFLFLGYSFSSSDSSAEVREKSL